jgi:hypothetical protein
LNIGKKLILCSIKGKFFKYIFRVGLFSHLKLKKVKSYCIEKKKWAALTCFILKLVIIVTIANAKHVIELDYYIIITHLV